MVKFISLSSGSNGNCYYFEHQGGAFIVDAGIGPRTIKKRLQEHGLDFSKIHFVLVTHDHLDHIKSLGVICGKYQIPAYATRVLHNSLVHHFCTRGRMSGCARYTKLDETFEHDGVQFTPFLVSHDATQTVGYKIKIENTTFTLATDIGQSNEKLVKFAKESDVLILESNFDIDMLMRGPYSPELKVRICNSQGHLSNDRMAEILRQVYHNGLTHIFLCHLSENNNTPEKALESAEVALKSIGVKAGNDVITVALPRKEASSIYTF